MKTFCNCGKEFNTSLYKIRNNRGKYCSKKCMYTYRIRSSNLQYSIKNLNSGWFKKGSSGFIGNHSEITKNKISLKNKGRHKSPRTEFKKNDPRIIGKANRHWKGGITPKNILIRHSPEYKEWRNSVFERDNYMCQNCSQIGGVLHADHIKPFSLYENLRFDVSNGRTLCKKCHTQTDTYGAKLLCQKSA